MNSIKNIPDWMILDAFRYCLGRRSYQVAITAAWLTKNWKKIPSNVRYIIKQDLESEFVRDDKMRKDENCSPVYYPLGNDYNRQTWEQVRKLYNNV